MNQLSRILLWAFCLCIPIDIFAQSGHYKNGADAFGRADASVTDSDSWSLYNNVGALSDHEQDISVTFAYRNFHSILDLYSTAAGLNCPLGPFNTSLGFFRFGNEVFNEQSIILGIGHKIRHTSLGISLHYVQIRGEQIGKSEALAISFGGLTKISRELSVGGYVFNLNQTKISRISGEKLPTVMTMGVKYEVANFKVNLEAGKELDYNITFRSGVEYSIKKKMSIRTGIITVPFSSSYGLGFHTGKFIIDYGLRRSGILGISHMISVVFKVKTY